MDIATSKTDCATKLGVVYHLTASELNWGGNTYCLCGDIRVDSTQNLVIAAGTTVRGFKGTTGSLKQHRILTTACSNRIV